MLIEVALRFTAYVPDDTDGDEWVREHREEIIGSMRSRLEGECEFKFEDSWGDLIDYSAYCE